LQTICQGWTEAEIAAQRRLVEFQISQIGSITQATFNIVSPDQRSAKNPCISCIYWPRKQVYIYTSFGVIALLEAMINANADANANFTTEEKNRIRRNLESFKPTTLKDKAECNDILKLIMGFSKDKPRGADKKHIKIFTWEKLDPSLKKIFKKYGT
jgi:hypothetical protein